MNEAISKSINIEDVVQKSFYDLSSTTNFGDIK